MDGIGVGQTAACVIVGPGTLASLAFPVTGGEELTTFTADVWEIRNDDPNSRGIERSDSVVAIDFSTGGVDTDADGVLDQVNILGSFEIHCDDLVDARDDGVQDGSDSCTVTDQYVAVQAKDSTDQFECSSSVDALGNVLNFRCTKYDGMICNHVDPVRNDEDCTTTSRAGGCACVAPFANPLLVPAGATAATVTLGGALATDTVEPFIFGLGVQSPTTITAFDNIYVD